MSDTLVNLIARVPEDVHKQFRHAVIDKGTSMNQVVSDLILKWLKENAPAKGQPDE